jgi:chromosome segregation ATPase
MPEKTETQAVDGAASIPRRLVGYNRKAAERVLEEMTSALLDAQDEVRALQERVSGLEAELEKLQAQSQAVAERERLIARAMTVATETASRLEREAEAARDTAVAEARRQAEEIIQAAATEVAELRAEATRLEGLRTRVYADLRSALTRTLDRLDVELRSPDAESAGTLETGQDSEPAGEEALRPEPAARPADGHEAEGGADDSGRALLSRLFSTQS